MKGGEYMSNIGNKEVMSKNLKYYISKSGKDRRELAEIWGFPYSTVTEWINGRKYPRIDRIEVMADYFGILKSDLIEDKPQEHREMQKKNDIMSDIILKMNEDAELFSMVEALSKLGFEARQVVKPVILLASSKADK
jgi:transcriptional regulator with XRE-family HTH domain